MNTTKTKEVGTIYNFYASEVGNHADIATAGSELALGSNEGKMGRRWFIQGDKGMIVWHASAEETLPLCEKWLASNGYKAKGELPPDCFEYAKA